MQFDDVDFCDSKLRRHSSSFVCLNQNFEWTECDADYNTNEGCDTNETYSKQYPYESAHPESLFGARSFVL
jgi:hypothetical protein